MVNYDIVATHSCGHQERHTGGTTRSIEVMLEFHGKRKCSTCRPTCDYCHRIGDRENMVVVEPNVYCNDWCRQQAANPTHYREHNDIAIPGFLRHWADYSYHNDTCGNSEYDFGNAKEIRIWVEHEKVEDRDDVSCDLFTVEFLIEGDATAILYGGDDAATAALWAHAAEIVKCGPDPDDNASAAPMVAKIRELVEGK